MNGEAGRPIRVGDPLPDVSLEDQDGHEVSLRSWVGTSSLVLFFYPKDNTMFCTREACSFGDRYEEVRNLTAEVVGVSDDSPESHQAFAATHHLPFRLLSDPDGTVRRRCGTGSTLGVLPGRVTYIVDIDGVVRHIFRSQFQARKHVREALAALRAPQKAKGGN
jgi:peroxiredoxin Q/BCP